MRALGAFLALLAVVLIQITWLDRVPVLGLASAPAVVLVAAVVWRSGEAGGLKAAVVTGLLLDLGGAGPFGVHALALVLVAAVAWIAGRGLWRNALGFVLSCLLAAAAYEAVTGLVAIFAASSGPPLDLLAASLAGVEGGTLVLASLISVFASSPASRYRAA